MADAFHEFEHAGWERAAAHYGGAFGSLTPQLAGALLDSAGVAGAEAYAADGGYPVPMPAVLASATKPRP